MTNTKNSTGLHSKQMSQTLPVVLESEELVRISFGFCLALVLTVDLGTSHTANSGPVRKPIVAVTQSLEANEGSSRGLIFIMSTSSK
jgi:hypothetical protein